MPRTLPSRASIFSRWPCRTRNVAWPRRIRIVMMIGRWCIGDAHFALAGQVLGTVIRHAVTSTVRGLPIAVVGAALVTLLVAPIGFSA